MPMNHMRFGQDAHPEWDATRGEAWLICFVGGFSYRTCHHNMIGKRQTSWTPCEVLSACSQRRTGHIPTTYP
jgi:hypothetical protein